jgi:hypothetical protein
MERSGHPDLDAYLTHFAADAYDRYDLRADTMTPCPVATLRDPRRAAGQCSCVSDFFVWYARIFKPADVKLELLAMRDPQRDDKGMDFPSFAACGYEDRGPGSHVHVVVRCETSLGVFSVDWSAAQYGYMDFPLVQRLAADGSWERDWSCERVAT